MMMLQIIFVLMKYDHVITLIRDKLSKQTNDVLLITCRDLSSNRLEELPPDIFSKLSDLRYL